MKKKKITGQLNFNKNKISRLTGSLILGGGNNSTTPTTCTELVDGPHDNTGVGDGPAGNQGGTNGSHCKCK